MSRLGETTRRLVAEKRRALVAYLTAGDPDLQTSLVAARAVCDAGADILEVGVPFSDPVADGPVIEAAMLRSLAQGGGFRQALQLVRELRKTHATPVVLFGYCNPLLWEGLPASCAAARAAGVDGLLIVDVPLEEATVFSDAARAEGMDWVALVTPTTPAPRAAQIAKTASGFVYMVSMTGVTGGKLAETGHLDGLLATTRPIAPTYLGFGVRDAASAARAARGTDGVVVGSALVAALEAGRASGDGPARVAALVRELRKAIDAVPI